MATRLSNQTRGAWSVNTKVLGFNRFGARTFGPHHKNQAGGMPPFRPRVKPEPGTRLTFRAFFRYGSVAKGLAVPKVAGLKMACLVRGCYAAAEQMVAVRTKPANS